MNYVYILKSKKDSKLYIGCTKNIKERLHQHNSGLVASTKERMPFSLIYYEGFISKKDVFQREKWLKSGYGRNHMQKMLNNTLKSLGG